MAEFFQKAQSIVMRRIVGRKSGGDLIPGWTVLTLDCGHAISIYRPPGEPPAADEPQIPAYAAFASCWQCELILGAVPVK
jgi:hypothetical protein